MSRTAEQGIVSESSGLGARLLDSLHVGIALVHPESGEVRGENALFRRWFPLSGEGPDTIATRLPGYDPKRASDRFERRRPYRLEATTGRSPRELHVQLEFHRVEGEDGDVVLVEAVNISKQKEAEYMLDSYSRMVERQTRDLEHEKERVEKLLLNIMPRRVYEELKDFGTTSPQSFEAASVLMLDFVGFTELAISRDPGALIAELNDVFTSFDRIVEHFGCERIKTIGDAYMAVAGIPDPDPDHDVHLARAALRMRRFLERRNTSSHHRWECRIGIGRGSAIGSIVGIQKYVYDIFGPAVNIAARLEHLCDPMQILVTEDSYRYLRDEFVLTALGEVEMKGFSNQRLYSLDDEARPGR